MQDREITKYFKLEVDIWHGFTGERCVNCRYKYNETVIGVINGCEYVYLCHLQPMQTSLCTIGRLAEDCPLKDDVRYE